MIIRYCTSQGWHTTTCASPLRQEGEKYTDWRERWSQAVNEHLASLQVEVRSYISQKCYVVCRHCDGIDPMTSEDIRVKHYPNKPSKGSKDVLEILGD